MSEDNVVELYEDDEPKRNQLGHTREESSELYDALHDRIDAHDGPVTAQQVLGWAGCDYPEEGLARLGASTMVHRLLRGVTTRLHKNPDLKLRGGFRSAATKQVPGEYEVLRGDEWVRDTVFAQVKALQAATIAFSQNAAKMEESDWSQLDTKTRNLLRLQREIAESSTAVQIGVLDKGVKALKRRHKDFKELELLQDALEDFIDDSYEDE